MLAALKKEIIGNVNVIGMAGFYEGDPSKMKCIVIDKVILNTDKIIAIEKKEDFSNECDEGQYIINIRLVEDFDYKTRFLRQVERDEAFEALLDFLTNDDEICLDLENNESV